MTTNLLSVLREARSALATATTAEPGEAAVARKLARELDLAIARLRGEDEKDLMSIICHDLKDPLASIVMGAGYLKKTMTNEGEEARSARRVVEAIARSADRMSQVIGDFHDLSKLETGTLEIDVRPCDVVATVRATVGQLSKQAGERSLNVSFDAPAEPVVALCDPARVLQIVSKLAHNATKFTPPGGSVTVSIAADAKAARVDVRDTGRGIPPEIVNEIFDHAANARRSPREGPGLGLAIARGLVELQGGVLTVESRPGEGSTFTFTLPRPDGQV
jgi:two-component system phosphate regulon sensor histidine kinase PhoR